MLPQKPYSRGVKVRIKSGAKVRSLHPQRKEYYTTRKQVVTVHNSFRSWTREDGTIMPAEVSWAGSGGYWCYVDVNDVEPYTNPEATK